MNTIFRSYLRKFVLVFFDDVLIYSQSWIERLHQVRTVFDLMRQHGLFLKKSKCSFSEQQVAYLGHIVTKADVAVDPTKIQAITEWPQPTTVRALRGFLGLIGYYHKFIMGYGDITSLLTSLLK